jgi:hypothetical protein
MWPSCLVPELADDDSPRHEESAAPHRGEEVEDFASLGPRISPGRREGGGAREDGEAPEEGAAAPPVVGEP